MNKNVLTLLGCSGSLAIMLGAANLAEAETTKLIETNTSEAAGIVEITFSAPQTDSTVAPVRSVESQYANVNPVSDTIGDSAIANSV